MRNLRIPRVVVVQTAAASNVEDVRANSAAAIDSDDKAMVTSEKEVIVVRAERPERKLRP